MPPRHGLNLLRRRGCKKSKGHIAWIKGGRESYEQGGQVYIAPRSNPLDIYGHRMGGRWESSRAHWDRYFEPIWKEQVED